MGAACSARRDAERSQFPASAWTFDRLWKDRRDRETSARAHGAAPLRKIVVRPVWIWLEGALHQIAAIVEDKNYWTGPKAAHVSNVVRRQLMRPFAGDENCSSFRICQSYSK